ncbi:major myo-inositol transporter iolT [Mollisia scopiformis]|uniref:Major myo-inositol transporter iolT n=1 Tax=Mollisia scopiformis TaxID=149040 RepID=A0A194XDI8_MOLSC|nr:major myo-inositol transporter iolT [Mollisia scopiformis]KUJ18219.1 major myo-inositol transporter iolT [Mollisia scopiformis]
MAVFEQDPDPIVTRLVNEDTVPWYRKRYLRSLYFVLFPACMGIEMTSGFDSQLINALQFIPPFNTYFGDGYIDPTTGQLGINPPLLGIINASYSLGAIFAVPVAPYFNQLVGRRWAIMSGSVSMVIGALLQGFAQHVAMYIIARMLLGFGIVFAIISGSALIGELAYPKERPIMTSLFSASYFFGAIIAAAISLRTAEMSGNWAWRIPSLLQCFPSILQILFVFISSTDSPSWLPESPRYLISKDRDEEAFEILVKYHAEGDRDSIFVRAEMIEIKTTLKLEQEISKQTWIDMLRTSGMRRRVFIASMMGLFTQWSGNTLISYYLSTILDMIGYNTTYAKTRINISNQCWSLVSAGIAALTVTRFPRRRMFLLGTISMLLVFIGWTVSMERVLSANAKSMTNNSAAIAVLFFIYAYSPCYNIGNNALTYTYLIEIFPFAERSRGIAIEQFFGRGAAFFSTYVNPIALKAITWKYLAVYCGWIFVEFCFVWFLYPETYRRTLEELAFLFEDASLSENVASAVEKQIHFGENGVEYHPGKRSFMHLETLPAYMDERSAWSD